MDTFADQQWSRSDERLQRQEFYLATRSKASVSLTSDPARCMHPERQGGPFPVPSASNPVQARRDASARLHKIDSGRVGREVGREGLEPTRPRDCEV